MRAVIAYLFIYLFIMAARNSLFASTSKVWKELQIRQKLIFRSRTALHRTLLRWQPVRNLCRH